MTDHTTSGAGGVLPFPSLAADEPNPQSRLWGAPVLTRLMRRTTAMPDGCWLWRGGLTTKGYGSLRSTAGTESMVHRIAYKELVGFIPIGLEIDHLCGTRNCINPQHLEAVTHAENLRRSGSSRLKSVCKLGHRYTKLTTGYDRNGHKRCKPCGTERKRAWRAERSNGI